MTHTFSKSAFYSFGDIPLAGPLPLIFSQLQWDEGGLFMLPPFRWKLFPRKAGPGIR